MLRLKHQYFGYLMGRTESFEKTPMLEKIEGKRRRGRQSEDKEEKGTAEDEMVR